MRRRLRPRAGFGTGVLAGLLMALLSGAGQAAAAPSPSPSPTPTEPLPIEIVVHPDSDVLGQPGVLVADGLPAPPKIAATGWTLVDVDSGAVLAAENARAQLLPASTLKLLTAVGLGPTLSNDDTLYTATPAAEAVDGTRVGLSVGSVYRQVDLFNALLMASGNDTAVALSEQVGGDEVASVLMNRKARELGAADTVAVNTSGLDAPGQVTSARDLALIGTAVLDDPRFAPIVARASYDFPDVGTDFGPERGYYPIYNHNKMIGVYPGTLGLKTGFTVAARGSFVGAAERDGRRLMCTILHSEGQESDHCMKLLDWAFAAAPPEHPVTTLTASAAASAAPQTPTTSDAAGPAVDDGAAGSTGSTAAGGASSEPGRPGQPGALSRLSGWLAGLPRWLLLALVGAGLVAAVWVGWGAARLSGRERDRPRSVRPG
jgi:D-alanyl-D-alanine carboxypeptidase (penicillin-binding protein 5/6)